MCCSLAAVLGVLVHVGVTRQTVSATRDKALEQLHDATRAYEAGEALPPESGLDPAALPQSLRQLALSGRRGAVVGERDGRPTMWAAAPAGGRGLAT
ncbi:two-component sensor histidine kinase, partial [Streptomyces goshikiensis]